eukprot:GHVL01007955.1.p1 GENE.GHVL01007955.1~~GHVL01007955.1.p1  ORF type:complete len:457 (-),score=98.99 GHVL01007955.1:1199-2479(-)
MTDASAYDRRKHVTAQIELEKRLSTLNMNKVRSNWIKILRVAKTNELKGELESLNNTLKRDIDRKDAAIQMISRDIDDAQEQQRQSVMRHMEHQQVLINIQKERMQTLESDYERDVQKLLNGFEMDEAELLARQGADKQEVLLLIAHTEAEENSRCHDETADQNAQCQMLQDCQMEINGLVTSNLVKKTEKLKEECQRHLTEYRNATDNKVTEYKKLQAKDVELSKNVDSKTKSMQKLESSIEVWLARINRTKSECAERNGRLKAEKAELARHVQDLKNEMSCSRTQNKQRLTNLILNSTNCIEELKKTVTNAENIIRSAELCRKLEFERGDFKLEMPESDVDDFANSGLSNKDFVFTPHMISRYNKAFLDKAEIDKYVSSLKSDNCRILSLLRQFIDGVSISPDVLNKYNTLLVVNGRTSTLPKN